jgi:hypothetical protein
MKKKAAKRPTTIKKAARRPKGLQKPPKPPSRKRALESAKRPASKKPEKPDPLHQSKPDEDANLTGLPSAVRFTQDWRGRVPGQIDRTLPYGVMHVLVTVRHVCQWYSGDAAHDAIVKDSPKRRLAQSARGNK